MLEGYQHPQYLLEDIREGKTSAFHILRQLDMTIVPATLGKRMLQRIKITEKNHNKDLSSYSTNSGLIDLTISCISTSDSAIC